jgi:hypothetical protein
MTAISTGSTVKQRPLWTEARRTTAGPPGMASAPRMAVDMQSLRARIANAAHSAVRASPSVPAGHRGLFGRLPASSRHKPQVFKPPPFFL